MKVAVAALPAFGHLYPLVPLSVGLQRAGAEVVFVTGTEFAGRLPARTVAGAEESWAFSHATSELGRRIASGEVPTYEDRGRILFVELCAPHLAEPTMASLQRERPDLVVFEQTDVAAAMAAHRLGIPAHCLAIVGWGRQWSYIYDAVATMAGAPPSALAQSLIDPHPPFLADSEARPPFPSLPMRPTPWSPDGPVPAWLLEPRHGPRAYVTLGTVFGSAELLRAAAVEVASTGCEVVVATGPDVEPRDLGELPGSIHAEKEVPQAYLLAHVDLVVHHGGTGTVIGSLTHGLPQVVMPQGADQFWNADHLSAEGACRVVMPDAPPGSIATAVTALLEERAPERAAARRLGGVLEQMPSPDSVARQLLGLSA